jgi:nitrite reductase/ring-hydroxylating ferredoxin subunit
MADELTLICESTDLLEKGQGIRFELEQHGLKLPAFVIRFRDRPRAYLNQCGHIPVELDWMPGVFFDDEGEYLICSTHGALYSPETGRCVSGRCNGRGLTALDVIEENNRIYLADKTKA